MDTEVAFVRSFSTEYQELGRQAKKRYREKLDLIDKRAPNPYAVAGELVENFSDTLPKIEYADIYNYLVTAPSPVTKEELKANKSLQGYNYLTSGWVGAISTILGSADGSKLVVKAKVRHSQSVSSSGLVPWVAAEQNGTIICAHCTCKAGLGEACSHIAALLFAVEAHTKAWESTACTSAACSWLPPTLQNVEYAQVKDIDFSSPSAERKKKSSQPSSSASTGSLSSKSSSSSSSALPKVQRPTPSDLSSFL